MNRKEETLYHEFEIIGNSKPIQNVKNLIHKTASVDTTVLITGNNGTRKDLIAHNIHLHSDRSNKSFINFNCTALPVNMIESELFGYEKGMFTKAISDKDGHFKIANKGTLFLDEVGEIPMPLQVKLLRAIDTGEILPVGAINTISVDVRLIAATNRNLEEEIEKGNFREDLFYRLNVIEIKLPALSEREEDIPLLVQHFIQKYNRELNRHINNTDNATMRILRNHEWKGGIRELENVIERALILTEGDYISQNDLPPNMVENALENEMPERLKEATSSFERQHIQKILRRTSMNKEETASILGISLSSLYRKMDDLNIQLN